MFVGLDVLIDSSGQEEHGGPPPWRRSDVNWLQVRRGGAARQGTDTSGTDGRSRAAAPAGRKGRDRRWC